MKTRTNTHAHGLCVHPAINSFPGFSDDSGGDPIHGFARCAICNSLMRPLTQVEKSAPGLLAALKKAESLLTDMTGLSDTMLMDIRAAIAKAEGR